MKKITVKGHPGLTTTQIPFSTGLFPVWFDDDPKNPKFISKDEVEFVDMIKEIAESYHDRICMSSSHGAPMICDCCAEKTTSKISIEHDSKDYSKDKGVCMDCYTKIHEYWVRNNYRKIPFLKSGIIPGDK